MRVEGKRAVPEQVVVGLIDLLCAGLALLPVGVMKVFNVWHPGVAFISYFAAAMSLIFLLQEFLSFFLGEEDKSKEVAEMRIEVDMRLVLKFYIPMLLLLILAMFLLNAAAFKEGKAWTVVGLYALFLPILFAHLVFIQILYRTKSKRIIVATTFLNVILHQYPIFYMVITQTPDFFIGGFTLFNLVVSVYVMLNRLW